jgi:hypothetical protein
MSRLLEFFLGSILITVFTVAFLFFSAVHYILRPGNVADCAWYGSARAWLDSNADGRVNPDEPPLSNVKIHVDDKQNQLLEIGWPVITDQEGDVQLSMPIPECSGGTFEIFVEIPKGYRATTRPRIEVQPDPWQSLRKESVYYFGFAPER